MDPSTTGADAITVDPTARPHRPGRSWFHAFDWFLVRLHRRPDVTPDNIARARFTVGLLCIYAVAAVFFAVQTRLYGSPASNTIICAVGAVFYLVALWFIRRSGNARAAGLALVASIVVALASTAITGAGYRALVSPWAMAAALVITYLAGVRIAAACTVGLLSGAAVLLTLESQGRFHPNPAAIEFMFKPITQLMAGVMVLAALLFVTSLFQAANARARKELEERGRRLEAANASLAAEMNARLQVEVELRQAQKLESVGRLSAGVAHEINTPIQFVSDSVSFVRDSIQGLRPLIDEYRRVAAAIRDPEQAAAVAEELRQAEDDADLEFLLDNVPDAIERALDGTGRIAKIVQALKRFAHPDQQAMSAVDLNLAIEGTLTISRNEYKYVADVDTDFGELPRVECHAGEINQVVLNLVVNAAHAIGDVVKGTEARGRITVQTRVEGPWVVIRIGDTGGGIPEDIRHRVFDPFFTTKEVGRGTGQGLAIARTIVTDTHGGEIDFETELGRGTTFIVKLPIARPARQARAA